MLIKVFTCGNDGYDSLSPIGGEDFTVNMYRLPRGYYLEKDENSKPYILCPNGCRVYDFDSVRNSSSTVKFSYPVDGKTRIVRLHIDEEATHNMLYSGEDYRNC
jgi:hypothetical protein